MQENWTRIHKFSFQFYWRRFFIKLKFEIILVFVIKILKILIYLRLKIMKRKGTRNWLEKVRRERDRQTSVNLQMLPKVKIVKMKISQRSIQEIEWRKRINTGTRLLKINSVFLNMITIVKDTSRLEKECLIEKVGEK